MLRYKALVCAIPLDESTLPDGVALWSTRRASNQWTSLVTARQFFHVGEVPQPMLLALSPRKILRKIPTVSRWTTYRDYCIEVSRSFHLSIQASTWASSPPSKITPVRPTRRCTSTSMSDHFNKLDNDNDINKHVSSTLQYGCNCASHLSRFIPIRGIWARVSTLSKCQNNPLRTSNKIVISESFLSSLEPQAG